MKIPDALGREPALWIGLLAAVGQLLTAFLLPGSPEQQGLVNATIAAAGGALTAYLVAQDQFVPAAVGALQAVFALAVGFGWQLPADQQSVLSAAVVSLAAMFVRTQVVAPVPVSIPGRHALHDE